MADAYIVSSAGALTKNGVSVTGLVALELKVNYIPAQTTSDGTVVSVVGKNVELVYRIKSSAEDAIIRGQSAALGSSSRSIGVNIPEREVRTRQGDTVQFPSGTFTVGAGELAADPTGTEVQADISTALAKPV